jgi:myo-inositol catabolism protein IolC
MKTITKTYNVYSFDELDEKGQDKALNNLWDINVDYDWWESVYNDAEDVGINITAFEIDRYCRGELNLSAKKVALSILENHGELCGTYKTAKDYLIIRHKANKNYLEDIDNDFKNSIFEEYLLILRDEYEYLTSRESIIDTINANEYQFTSNGELFHA